jgi:hypothetical protein
MRYISERPVIHPARDLNLCGQILRAALALMDLVNPISKTPTPLSMDEKDRAAHVAGYLAMREVYAQTRNAERRAAWRAKIGGTEDAEPPVRLPVKTINTGNVRRLGKGSV